MRNFNTEDTHVRVYTNKELELLELLKNKRLSMRAYTVFVEQCSSRPTNCNPGIPRDVLLKLLGVGSKNLSRQISPLLDRNLLKKISGLYVISPYHSFNGSIAHMEIARHRYDAEQLYEISDYYYHKARLAKEKEDQRG